MSAYRHSRGIDLQEFPEHNLGQFLRDIALHLVVLAPWIRRSIDVETCPAAEIVGVVFALDFHSSRAGVGVQDCDALLARAMLEEAFLGAVVPGAGKTGEPDEQRDFV